MKHKVFVCNCYSGYCYSGYCQFCDGGLFSCVRCGSAEGASTTECVGERLSAETLDLVYNGRLDFRDGLWQAGNGAMPCHTHPIQIER